MRRAAVNHRATSVRSNQFSPNGAVLATVVEEQRECNGARNDILPCRQSGTTKEKVIVRMGRIGMGLIVLLYFWSKTSAAVASPAGRTRVTSTSNGKFEDDAAGKVLRAKGGNQLLALKHEHEEDQAFRELQRQRRHPEQHYNHNEGHYPLQSANLEETEADQQCGLYLAPSTIPGAGLGMFSTIHRSVGEIVGTGEVIVPLVELSFYRGHKNLFNPFINYYWRGGERGLHGLVAEHRENELHAYIPGMDAAINCNLALVNLDLPSSEYDDGHISRGKHPMAGAMTPYHSTPSRATRDIPAGGELFKFYGDNWFIAREDKFGRIPLSDDYSDAQRLLGKFEELRQLHFPTSNRMRKELWSLVKDTIGTSRWESRIMKALPREVEDAALAAKSEIASLHQPQAIRSIADLRQHGTCVDSIRPGPSTLPSQQAGRGAFATRNFSKGSIITGSPLIHLPEKELLTIFRMERNNSNPETGEEIWLRHVDDIIGYQGVLNYCYGHPQSTLLLCPYGPGVNFVNHNSSLANVKIQWAQNGLSHNSSWLSSRRVEDLEWEYGIGLAFDYLATRDIIAGDELFLDYGEEFEEALTRHVQSWQPPPSTATSDYTSAERFNEHVANSPLRTEAEQKHQPYPFNLQIRCHSRLVGRTMRQLDVHKDEFHWTTREHGYPCRVMDRINVSSTDTATQASLYTVELKIPQDEIGVHQKAPTINYVQKRDVDRRAISFFNKPYTTDLFSPSAFRKEIGIPDHLFPPLWRNL